MSESGIKRGEIWDVNFDPQVGDEITKIRPAIVLDAGSAKLDIRIAVPITGWQDSFERDISKVRLGPSIGSGLAKVSAADAYQIKSLSTRRFIRRRGTLATEVLDEIALAVATLIDTPF